MSITPAAGPGAAVLGIGLVLPEPRPTSLQPTVSDLLASGPACACSELPAVSAVPARALRRLGRAQRLALGAAQRALDDFGAARGPAESAAVLVGTGLGCLGETAAFLENMVEREEREPRPASFVNSVHNSPAAQISIAFGLRGENHTFTHGQISFELALWKALALLSSGRAELVLLVGVDELSAYVVTAGQEYGWWRRDDAPLAPMAGQGQPGTLPGEGAGALVLGRPAAGLPRVVASHVRPLAGRGVDDVSPADEARFIRGALASWGRAPDDVDLFLLGANGSARLDAAYGAVADALGRPCGVYKQSCGEFCSAPAVGVALAARAAREGRVPDEIRLAAGEAVGGAAATIVIYHLHESGYHSVCLVTA